MNNLLASLRTATSAPDPSHGNVQLLVGILIFLSLCVSASAQMFTNSPYANRTRWSLVYSNNNDGWKGPAAVCEISGDDEWNILRTIPINYQPFNTNASPANAIIAGKGILIITNDSTFTIMSVKTDDINRAVKDGTVCTVRGHVWESGCGVFGCLVIHGDEPMRHCILCKKTESRELGPWK